MSAVRACDRRVRAWSTKRPSEWTDIERAWVRHMTHGASFDPSDYDDDGSANPKVSSGDDR